jgi:uncharacterized protein with gpF-like domain
MVNLKTRSAKLRYHRQVVRQMMIMEIQFARQLTPILKAQFKASAHEIRQGNRHINSAVERYRFDLLKTYQKMYKQIALSFSGYVRDRVPDRSKSVPGRIETKDADNYIQQIAVGSGQTEDERFYQAMQFWVNIYATRKVKQVDDTTIARIKEIIARNMEQDMSNSEIADEIERIDDIASASRAMTIARTETHSVAVMAMDTTIRTSVIGDSLQLKGWIPFVDERTREEHAVMGLDLPIPIDEDFIVGDEPMSFPGDPKGSAWNVINCRCVVEYFTAKANEENSGDEEAA